jgi:hypothetical protein
LFAVRFEGHACRGKLIEHVIKFTALDADRCGWIVRVLRAGDIEIIRDAAEC